MTLKETFREVLIRQMEWRGDEILLNRILAELVAAVPTVDKAAIERLVARTPFQFGDPCYERGREFINALYAILTPTAGPRWCSHVVWEDRPGIVGWYLADHREGFQRIHDRCRHCPICGVPRPTEV